jgi:hypothetical protein
LWHTEGASERPREGVWTDRAASPLYSGHTWSQHRASRGVVGGGRVPGEDRSGRGASACAAPRGATATGRAGDRGRGALRPRPKKRTSAVARDVPSPRDGHVPVAASPSRGPGRVRPTRRADGPFAFDARSRVQRTVRLRRPDASPTSTLRAPDAVRRCRSCNRPATQRRIVSCTTRVPSVVHPDRRIESTPKGLSLTYTS